MSKLISKKMEKMEILCAECGSPFWIDTEVAAVNNSYELWCPYCRKYIGFNQADLKRMRDKFKDKYGW